MAAKLVLSPVSLPWSLQSVQKPHVCLRTKPRSRFAVKAYSDVLFCAASATALLYQENPSSLFSLAAAADSGYSLASYYTSLGLFVISVPGLWSLIKRSVKSKVIYFV